MRKQLLITCGGGLGNRLLALASGLVVAKRHELELLVCWPTGKPGLPVGTPEGFQCELSHIIKPRFPVLTVAEREDWLKQPHNHYSLERQQQETLDFEADRTYAYGHGRLRGCGIAIPELRSELRLLQLTRTVHDHITEAHVMLGTKTDYLGCLIRCYGHPKSQRWNPAVKFDHYLFHEVDPCDDVYLACDEPALTDRFFNRNHRICSLPKPVQRNTKEAIEMVMADIHMLTHARKCVGTPFSALSELIATMREDGECLYPG